MMNSKHVLSALSALFVLATLTACGGGGGDGGGGGGTGAPAPTPKTGQTNCFDTYTAIACGGNPGQQDGNQVGVAWPSPRFTQGAVDTAACVTDNLTGLMWTRNANLPAGTGVATGGARTWQQALDYANNLTLCGFSDWRLGNRKELRSLANYNLADNAATLNTLGFTNVQAGNYWSSSSWVGTPAYAWFVQVSTGFVYHRQKIDSSLYVWPVRAGQ